ncbi:outer membrane protein TolC [Neolewinella xylanilytica]|uniref:Outer membrane protein TolC n=1 Tax=Neolewinella xylanilytica TaxID=1514080 RepID=A0A2S6IBP3_9BACT|nr:TolC family protein [Neolewinella xylanilytica]PPK88931.1 outer membrane protein TolC [Neolewinella xylanilytica]
MIALRLVVFLSLFLAGSVGRSQDLPVVLTEDAFLLLVAEHHPLAVRADLQRARAEAVMRTARGNFDPKLYGDLSQKYFQGTQYYSVIEGGVKVPTWFGIELNAAYERNDGYYLNPEHNVPSSGLYAAGLTASLGQGLLFDERRAELQRARVYQQATVAERQILLNDLIYSAGTVYWNWAGALAALEVYTDALDVARQRYEAVAAEARTGNRPAIDTLEARILVQNRQLGRETALLDLANARARINAYLWIDGVVPVELEADTRALPPDEVIVAPIFAADLNGENPLLARTRLKISDLEIDERLQREYLKPRVDVKYNALLAGGANDPLEEITNNNYKWGVTFSQPLLLRKERGKLALTRVKLSETQLELSDKIADIDAKIAAATNEVIATAEQYDLAVRNAEDYGVLLAGERTLFRGGESSLFLVNTREVSYIDAQLKRVELMVKHRKARLARSYAAGQMPAALDAVVPSE